MIVCFRRFGEKNTGPIFTDHTVKEVVRDSSLFPHFGRTCLFNLQGSSGPRMLTLEMGTRGSPEAAITILPIYVPGNLGKAQISVRWEIFSV
jgi:hypothetical protein